MKLAKIITLLTDFGTRDTYVGVMKGVILSICPDVKLVDLTHEVPPQDVRAAAWQIYNSYRYFPPGTIHLAIVDPGVGTSRRPILVLGNGHLFIGPDNGLFTLLYQSGQPFDVYAITRSGYLLQEISATFHGRDIFAPVAGHLACGTPPERIGAKIADPVSLADMKPRAEGETLYGQVVWVDRFGNLITNITEQEFRGLVKGRSFQIKVGRMSLTSLHKTYAEVAGHAIIAIIGSSGYLEIAEASGNAARRLKIGPGSPVAVSRGTARRGIHK